MDTEKQRNYWLFLGEYTPQRISKTDLWDIDPAEKESDEQIYRNAIENYVNTSQEKLNISEGRLKKLTLLEFNSFHPSRNFEFERYFDEEMEFDQPQILVPSLEDELHSRKSTESLKHNEKPPPIQKPSLFNMLDQMNYFKQAEEEIWSDFGNFSERKK